MTRYYYGLGAGDVVTVLADDPTTADPAHKDLSPVQSTVQIWNDAKSALATGIRTLDPSTLTIGGSDVTSITPNGLGRVPFAGADGYTGDYWVKDATGNWWRFRPSVGLPAPTVVGSAVVSAVDTTAAKTALGLTTALDAAIVNAKGDLIVGTANDAVARQAAGANGTLVGYDSTTTTGLKAVDPSGYATKAGSVNQFADFSTVAPVGPAVPQWDSTTAKYIPTDLNSEFAAVDSTGRIVPQARAKYSKDIIVLNAGDPVPSDFPVGGLRFDLPTTASLIPILEGTAGASASGTTLVVQNTDSVVAGEWMGFMIFTSGETTTGTLPTLISSITPAAGTYGTLQSGPESLQSGSVQVDFRFAKCATNIAANTNHTITLNQARIHRSVVAFKLPNLVASSPMDQSTNNQGNGQTNLDLSVGPTGNMALTAQIGILGVGHNDGTGTTTRPVQGTNNWNVLAAVETDNGGSSRTLTVLYKAYANTSATPLQGTVHINASDGTTGAWGMVVASMKGA